MDSKQTSNNSKISSFFKKRLKLVYLLFFLIPLAYSFLWINQTPAIVDNTKHPDYLSFSVRSTHPAHIILVENEQDLVAWDIDSTGYKNLEFVGPIKSEKGINLKVNKLNCNDTLFIQGINLYSNNKLLSLSDGIKHIAATNARLADKNGVLVLIVEKSGVTLNIKSPTEWGKSEPPIPKKLLIALVFLFAFIIVIVLNPSNRYLILSIVLAVFVLAFCYFECNYSNGEVTLNTSVKIRNVEILYNQTPFFSTTKRYSSEAVTDVFSQPLNLETEKYLRFDIGDSLISLKQIKVKISTGIFSKNYNLSELPPDRFLLNDLILSGNTYYVTGNDPYIKFSSTSFISNLEFLLFLEHNKFLFLTIIVFLLFLCLQRIIDKRLNKLKLKPAYLTFLLIPLVYYQINQHWMKKQNTQNLDYVYFSAKTSRPSVFTLMNGSDSITSWVVDSPGFKYLQSKGHFNCGENFFLRITNLSKQDTVSLLSINLFHDGKTYSLFEKSNSVCKVTNVDYANRSEDFSAIVKKTGVPVIISLLPSNLLKKNKQNEWTYALITLFTFCTFIFILIFAPKQKFFIVSAMVTSIMMIVFFWICFEDYYHIDLSTKDTVKRADFFYNDNPSFQAKKIYLYNFERNSFKFQIFPSIFNFHRCDIGENHQRLKDIFISVNTGILRQNFDYNTISSKNILLNDMIRQGGEYIVCGDDPYFAFSSSWQVGKLHSIYVIRQNLFFFLSVLLLLILIIAGKYINKVKLPYFFMVVFFLVFIFQGIIIHLFNSENLILLSEKRNANPLPYFQTDSLNVYTKKLDNFILDQLPGRRNIIMINNLVQYSLFRQMINNQVIHFGEDGWMFFIGGQAKDNYENKQPLTIQELKTLENVLVERNEWLKKRGIHFYMVFPPMAQTVYEEYVGPRMRRQYKQTKSEQLLEYLKLNDELDIIDIYTPMMKAKDTSSRYLYFKNNCHWNFFGAYVAYYTMINYIKKDYPNIGEPLGAKDFKWVETKNYSPDLVKLMDIDEFYTSREYSPLINDKIITDTIYPFYLDLWSPAPPAIVLTKRTTYPTMYMYGDSYSGAILPFLFCNFSKSVFIWTPLFQPTIIEKEKPDMVIQEMVDMSINALLTKNKPLPELIDTTN